MTPSRPLTIRRSVALPRTLVDDLTRIAPIELKSNLNRLVIVALQDYVRSHERLAFDQAMAKMAADPNIQRELADIQEEFRGAESDGLPFENW